MTAAATAFYSFLSPRSLKVHLVHLMQFRTDSRALSLPKMPGPRENKHLLCVLSGIKNQLAIEFLPVCFQEYLMHSCCFVHKKVLFRAQTGLRGDLIQTLLRLKTYSLCVSSLRFLPALALDGLRSRMQIARCLFHFVAMLLVPSLWRLAASHVCFRHESYHSEQQFFTCVCFLPGDPASHRKVHAIFFLDPKLEFVVKPSAYSST